MGKVSRWYNWWKQRVYWAKVKLQSGDAASICEIIVSIEEKPQAYT